MSIRKRIALGALATAVTVIGAATPASAHRREITVGGAIGTVGPNHSGARICELSTGLGIGYIELKVRDGYVLYMAAQDGCSEQQFASVGGIGTFRVGWDRGGGILWSGWVDA